MKALYPNAEVHGVEHIKQLAEKSKENINKFASIYDTKSIHIHNADGRKGLKSNQPLDFIHCGAGKIY